MRLHSKETKDKDDERALLIKDVQEHRAFHGVIKLFRLKRQFVKVRPHLGKTVFPNGKICYYGKGLATR